MTLAQIRHFLSILEAGTYLEASFSLHCSQSALTKSIQKLEQELGVILFNRSTRPLALTREGEIFYPYAQQIDQLYQQMGEDLTRSKADTVCALNVGMIYFGRNNPLSAVMGSFLKEHPEYQLTITEGTSTPLLTDLAHHNLDICFISRMYLADHPLKAVCGELEEHSLFLSYYYVVVGKDHPLAGMRSLDYKDLQNQKLIVPQNQMDVYACAMEQAFQLNGASYRPYMHLTNIQSIINMVSSGVGVSILSEAVLGDSPNLVRIPLRHPLVRDTRLVVHRDRRPGLTRFVRYFQQAFSTPEESC